MLTNLENLENLEISGNFVTLENSGNLKCTLEIFGAQYYQRQKCRPMTLVSENIRFMLIMQIFAGVPLGGGVKRHSTLYKKYAKMTATVILYIGFSLYNCLEKTTQTVWKTWKTQGISFCHICKHPDYCRTASQYPLDHCAHTRQLQAAPSI